MARSGRRLERFLLGARAPRGGRQAGDPVGSGAFWSDAGEAISRFAEKAGIPITSTSAARGLVPDSDHWCLGSLLSTTTALGTLGVGMRFALGAKAARPDEPVILFVGDGAFGFSAMEFESAARQGLPVIWVVSNNCGWGDVAHEQDLWFGAGRRVASDLSDARYDRMAAAFGGHGEYVATVDELRPALDRALDSGKASIVNVQTDPAALSDLLRNLGTMGIN